jgi:hypothetical protein
MAPNDWLLRESRRGYDISELIIGASHVTVIEDLWKIDMPPSTLSFHAVHKQTVRMEFNV